MTEIIPSESGSKISMVNLEGFAHGRVQGVTWFKWNCIQNTTTSTISMVDFDGSAHRRVQRVMPFMLNEMSVQLQDVCDSLLL